MLPLVDLLEQVGRILANYATAIAGVLGRHVNAAPLASFSRDGADYDRDAARRGRRGPVTVVSPGSLLAEAGLAPVTRQSGSSRRVGFRYTANHHLRAAWGQWMLTAIPISPWTRAGLRCSPNPRPEPQPGDPLGRRLLGPDPLALLAGPPPTIRRSIVGWNGA